MQGLLLKDTRKPVSLRHPAWREARRGCGLSLVSQQEEFSSSWVPAPTAQESNNSIPYSEREAQITCLLTRGQQSLCLCRDPPLSTEATREVCITFISFPLYRVGVFTGKVGACGGSIHLPEVYSGLPSE